MTEYEIDIMLNIARLQPITRPFNKIDYVILTALRCAHERYPYFESNNADKVLESMETDEMLDLRGFYEEQKLRGAELVKYYEKDGHKNALDRMFEETYTDYTGSGILNYIRDIFKFLTKDGTLSETETAEYTDFMRVY
jgi:hypothetical protein